MASSSSFHHEKYQQAWPAAGFSGPRSGYSNWAARTRDGRFARYVQPESGSPGLYGFETAFHEGIHQWDEQIFAALRQQAIKLNKFFPRGVSHSLIFFTAGEAVRSVVPDHVPYADRYGVWERGLGPMKIALQEAWKPYLDGRGTRDEAFAALVLRTAVEPPKKSN